MLWCGVRVGVWLAGGWGLLLGVAGSLGPCCGGLGLPPGLVGRVGVRGVALPGGLCLQSRVLWGSWSLALVAVAVPSSSSGACEVPLWQPGSLPGGEGVVVHRVAVFPTASSVGVARSPRVGVPSILRVVSGGWWVCAGVICTVSDSCFDGACWGCASPGVVRHSLGVGRRWSLRRGMPFVVLGRGACRGALFLCASVPAPAPLWSLGGFLPPLCVPSGASSL